MLRANWLFRIFFDDKEVNFFFQPLFQEGELDNFAECLVLALILLNITVFSRSFPRRKKTNNLANCLVFSFN